VRGEISALATALVAPVVRRITGLLVLAEDRPRRENRVSLEPDRVDELGLPRLSLHHRYDDRDVEARRTLARGARTIHRAAGSLASYFHRIDTFSHALGTVRMGNDPATAPLDPAGRFRGVRGLYVSDGSALPTSAGVNPSLTIAANALRIGRAVEEDLRMAGKA
jgi:choline dehydrogenase-like flavoprotein